MSIDFGLVESVFIGAVQEQAEKKNVSPEQLSLILFPLFEKGRFSNKASWRTRVKILSMDGSFDPEVVKLKAVTMYDLGGNISKAVMKIFEHEVEEHNTALKTNIGSDIEMKLESIENYPQFIDLDKMECYIQVQPCPKDDYKLIMTLVYDHSKLRDYDISKEFADVV